MKGLAALGLVVTFMAACSTAPTVAPTGGPSAASGSTESPSPSPDISTDPAAGLPYSCDGRAFDIRVLSGPAEAEMAADPASAALRGVIQRDPSFMPQRGWWLVSRTGLEAQFLARVDGGFAYATVEANPDGQWRAGGWGSCGPTFTAGGRTTVRWWLEPGKPPAADDRTINVIVVDVCNENALNNRLDPPTIRATERAVLVIFTAAPAPDNGDVCWVAKPFATTVALHEPLGDRQLLDGATWPARDATVPLPP